MASSTKMVVFAVLMACGDGAHRTPDAGTTTPPDAAGDAPIDAPPEQATLCRDGWCWVVPQPQGNQVRAIWGASPSDVWALADGATTLHYDGSAWQLGVLPAECLRPFACQPYALFGTASNNVWAATSGGVYHWDGARWSASLLDVDPLAIGGLAANDIWVFDFKHQKAVHWDGAAWTPNALPATGWRTIALGGSDGTLWNVSNQGGRAKWNGTGWDMVDAGTHPAERGVVIDATHIALNTGAFWNGTDWTVHPPPDQTSFGAIAATSLDNVWVSGLPFGIPHRFHWNGTSWETPETPADQGLPLGMWIDGDGRVWAGQDNAQIRVFHDGAWESKTMGDNLVTAAFGTADDDIWAITSNPARAVHWNGSTWTEFPLPHDKPYYLSRIWGSAPDNYWIAAGSDAGAVTERHLLHWNGATWTAETHGNEPDDEFPNGFASIWGSSASDVYAVSGTALWHFDGHDWTDTGRPVGGNDVFGSGASDVWVTLGGNSVAHWNGNVWSAIELPAIVTYGVANSPNDVWFTGSGGVHFDGALFTSLGGFTEGSPVGTPSAMYTFGPGSMTAWTPGPTTTAAFFEAFGGGFRTPSGRAYAAGRGLLVHE